MIDRKWIWVIVVIAAWLIYIALTPHTVADPGCANPAYC